MITHKIKAPSMLTRVMDSFRAGVTPSSYPRQALEQRVTTHSGRKPDKPPGFDKRRFALYIENVRKNYRVQDMVTYDSIPTIPGELPSAMYQIVYIQELWYDVAFDETVQEPRALLLRNLNYMTGTFIDVAASRVRKLTYEEQTLADLRYNAVQGSA